MIVSHRFRFIFIKTGKVGGTSLEIALSKHLGDDDIVTPIKAKDEALRQELGFPGARNYAQPFGACDWREKAQYAASLVRGARHRPMRFRNHTPARAAKRLLGPEIWNGYFKFTLERDPWSQSVSRYFWEKPDIEFAEYIRRGANYRRPNFDIYAINGIPAVDEVVLYEDLARGLERVRARCGYPEDIFAIMKSIRAKGEHNPRKMDYRGMYNAETRDIVATQFAREIKLFGYRFEDDAASASGAEAG